MGMKGRRIALVALLALAGGTAAWLAAGHGRIQSGATSDAGAAVPSEPPTPAERVAMLSNGIRAIADGVRDAPRDRWDPAYVVDLVGRNADSLRAWVNANTTWVPYPGVLRGPVGMLMDRQGNSLDRAILLATLLEGAGHTARLAHGRLTVTQVKALLPGLTAAAAAGTAPSEADAEGAADVLPAQYDLDATSIEHTASAQSASIRRMAEELGERVAEQTLRLAGSIEDSDRSAEWDARLAEAIEALADHWWVQWLDEGKWMNLDLLPIEPPTADRAYAVQELPEELYHHFSVRLVAEAYADGKLVEQTVLDHTSRPSATIGAPMRLQIWPASWPKELHSDPKSRLGVRGQALGQTEWAAVLLLGDQVASTGVLTATQPASGSPRAAAGNPFGGLGGAIADAAHATGRRGELTAVWIEYELRAPGEAPRSYRRALFDLVGPAARHSGGTVSPHLDDDARLRRSLALMFRADILPVASRIAPEYALYLGSRSVTANQELLRAVSDDQRGAGALDPDSLMAKARELVSPLYPLAFARLEWGPHAGHIYLNRTNLLTRHRHVGIANDMLTMRGSIEVIARDIGVSLSEPDAVAVRLQQGILDTNAEALWWSGEGINSTADAFAEPGEWVTLTPDDSTRMSQLPIAPDARSAIGEDLAKGLTVVIPKRSVSRGPDQFIGWWRIDPHSGATSGTPGNGWAQCGSEYSLHIGLIAHFAEGFAFEYAMCHGLAQAMNAFKYAVSELRSRGYSLYAGPIEVADPIALAQMNEKACVIGAMFAGVLSTIPFFLEVRMIRGGGMPRGPTVPRVNPFANTEPVVVRPPAPEPPLPPAKTQPMRPQVKTQPDLGPKPPVPEPLPAPPRPGTLDQARRELAEAKAAQAAAEAANTKATTEWVQYRANKPRPAKGWEGNPSEWNPDRDAELTAIQREASSRNTEAINRVNEARRAERELTIAARRAAGASGLGSALAAGTAGVANALQPGAPE